jgi:hypothetical protein
MVSSLGYKNANLIIRRNWLSVEEERDNERHDEIENIE